jgi:Protein of unknown function (DUF2585)
LPIKKLLPWLSVTLILLAAALQLHRQGRQWICSCGRVLLWTSGAWTSDNSQHWFDPYSFTHILHGFAFCGLLALALPRVSLVWRLVIAVATEALWEILENTNTVIDRYREATAALGYHGDSVINSIGDIIACSFGFWLASQLGWRRSIAVFVLVEVVLLVWIRDSLTLEILMLIHPIDAIRNWQLSH